MACAVRGFLVISAVLFVVEWASHTQLSYGDPHEGNPDAGERRPPDELVVGGWMQYDSGWYIEIARHSYTDANVESFHAGRQSSVALWPAFPLVVRGVALVTGGDYEWAAYLTTFLAGLGCAVLLWAWLGTKMSALALGCPTLRRRSSAIRRRHRVLQHLPGVPGR